MSVYKVLQLLCEGAIGYDCPHVHTGHYPTLTKVLEAAKKEGWKHTRFGNYHATLCPDCARRFERDTTYRERVYTKLGITLLDVVFTAGGETFAYVCRYSLTREQMVVLAHHGYLEEKRDLEGLVFEWKALWGEMVEPDGDAPRWRLFDKPFWGRTKLRALVNKHLTSV